MALQVEYKTLNKWFKLYSIDIDLQSLDGLIAISHKQKDFEKEREYIEQAISLSSLNSRHEEYNIKFKHRLEKLLGTYKQKEIPPESHMDVVYTDLTNYMEILDKMPYGLGYLVRDKKKEEIRRKIWDYFDKIMLKGKTADNKFDYKTAADMYERLVAECYYDSFPYDRLMTLYFNYKLYEDEVRVITSAINTFVSKTEVIRSKFKDSTYNYYDKRIERWEKRLVSAKKRFLSSQKKNDE